MRPLASIARAGSWKLADGCAATVDVWTCRMVHDVPLSSETRRLPTPPQVLKGTYTVPSVGDTFTCPCKPPQTFTGGVVSGTEGPKVNPPSSLREQNDGGPEFGRPSC